MRTFILAVSALCLSTCLCACTSNDRQVSYNSGGVTQTFTDKPTISSFPLPVYPNAKPAGSVEAKDGGNSSDDDSSFMMLSSTDTPEQIRKFYAQKLPQDGWVVKENSFGPQLTKLDAHKPGLEASVMVAIDDSKQSSISLAVSKVEAGTPQAPGQPFVPDKSNPPTD